jgi:RHH-type proline utilization regulon transcriptional repressor/proline dehydrogenase/delta 1-pyrroline-5-carboxylate dehydrogenase
LIAARAVGLLHGAGVPEAVLQLLIGDGPSVGARLAADPRIAAVCFTGSTDVARMIERQLAKTAAPDAMLIAETGGINAMIVDSTALPEQAVRDIVSSAFQSAGQRCSALRILYVQKDVEEKILDMLKGAVATLRIGDPWQLETDVGPVIDDEAREGLLSSCAKMEKAGRLIAKLEAPQQGHFVAPHIFRVSGIAGIEREVFGPVLHVASFEARDLDSVIADINARGYGLTFGLHTRIEARVQHVIDRVHAGNIYVNRNQIGAVVGSQPFGGEGLSGTGPKAGGPFYVRRFRKSGTVAEDVQPRGRTVALELPGPTGEANSLLLAPRGRVLCLGLSVSALVAQVNQALAAGNSVLAIAAGARAALLPLIAKGLPVEAVDGTAEAADLMKHDVDAVALSADPDTMRAVRRALAGREGPIIPLIDEAMRPGAFAHERVVCVDTTAAGGNAALLAAATS